MKKQILKFGKALNKAEQRSIHGGGNCGPIGCFGIPLPGCGTCEQFFELSQTCQMQVMVHADCFPN